MALAKIFKAYDIRATYPEPLNEEAGWKVGVATGRFLKSLPKTGGRREDAVLVSRDMRPHSAALQGALIDGLLASGLNVIDLGECDTSFIYFAVNHVGAAGGVQVTASHNPVQYNGFKISGRQARPIGADTGLKDIQITAESLGKPGSIKPAGKVEALDLWDDYGKHIRRFLAPLQRPIKVFVDGSNGMAGKLVPKVFANVDKLTIVPVNFEYGVPFVHEPNPLVAANMKPTQAGVKKEKADLGVCFDGDADRCILTDETGTIIGCDHLTAALVDHFVALDRRNPGNPGAPEPTVVFDLRSSKVVTETIAAAGAKARRSRVGHVFMKAALRETNGVFGGELSGHFYFKDNFFADSGAITFASVLSVLAAKGCTAGALIKPFRKYPQSGEINFRAEDKAGVIESVKEKYQAAANIDELDGVTVDAWEGRGWWFNVRASNTEPLLRLNAEARDPDTLTKHLAELKPMLGEEDHGH